MLDMRRFACSSQRNTPRERDQPKRHSIVRAISLAAGTSLKPLQTRLIGPVQSISNIMVQLTPNEKRTLRCIFLRAGLVVSARFFISWPPKTQNERGDINISSSRCTTPEAVHAFSQIKWIVLEGFSLLRGQRRREETIGRQRQRSRTTSLRRSCERMGFSTRSRLRSPSAIPGGPNTILLAVGCAALMIIVGAMPLALRIFAAGHGQIPNQHPRTQKDHRSDQPLCLLGACGAWTILFLRLSLLVFGY